MSEPNTDDLIGYVFDTEDGPAKVTRVGTNYATCVLLNRPSQATVRSVAQLRRHRELTRESD